MRNLRRRQIIGEDKPALASILDFPGQITIGFGGRCPVGDFYSPYCGGNVIGRNKFDTSGVIAALPEFHLLRSFDDVFTAILDQADVVEHPYRCGERAMLKNELRQDTGVEIRLVVIGVDAGY